MSNTDEDRKRHRLHVTKITSIGAVEAGDNPGAEITFWKRRPEPAARPVAKPTDVAEYVAGRINKLDERIARVHDTAANAEAIAADEGGPMTGRAKIGPPGTVRGEIDQIALEKVAKGEAANITEARPMAWKERPDLVAASRSAGEGTTAGVRRGDVTPTPGLPEQIADAVRERALELSAVPVGDNWTASQAELRSRIWKTKDGGALRALYTAAIKHGNRSKILKSDEHAEARRILKSWQEDPAVGLR